MKLEILVGATLLVGTHARVLPTSLRDGTITHPPTSLLAVETAPAIAVPSDIPGPVKRQLVDPLRVGPGPVLPMPTRRECESMIEQGRLDVKNALGDAPRAIAEHKLDAILASCSEVLPQSIVAPLGTALDDKLDQDRAKWAARAKGIAGKDNDRDSAKQAAVKRDPDPVIPVKMYTYNDEEAWKSFLAKDEMAVKNAKDTSEVVHAEAKHIEDLVAYNAWKKDNRRKVSDSAKPNRPNDPTIPVVRDVDTSLTEIDTANYFESKPIPDITTLDLLSEPPEWIEERQKDWLDIIGKDMWQIAMARTDQQRATAEDDLLSDQRRYEEWCEKPPVNVDDCITEIKMYQMTQEQRDWMVRIAQDKISIAKAAAKGTWEEKKKFEAELKVHLLEYREVCKSHHWICEGIELLKPE